jgi:hypothetical protein
MLTQCQMAIEVSREVTPMGSRLKSPTVDAAASRASVLHPNSLSMGAGEREGIQTSYLLQLQSEHGRAQLSRVARAALRAERVGG